MNSIIQTNLNQIIYNLKLSGDKILDSKMLYDGSITEELVQDWIQELKQEDILDEDGNLIYVKF